MKTIHQKISIKVFESLEELPAPDQQLLLKARKQLDHAYAPYSKFKVGAALRLINGEIFEGCNQENASYSLTMCAERVALFNAATNFPHTAVKEIAIVANGEIKNLDKPVTPCGACRQVICEFENRFDHPIRLLLQGDTQIFEIDEAKDLLAFTFDQSFLLG